ncbi:MAG TPA: hypothetical protein VHB47_22555 [Thermoanaerobaculia bacterium]|jgi:hypothetical protein|nr:hypothetical protein [Thermoanaerobaculia bacterium]
MSNPPAASNKRDELSGGNPGQDVSQPDPYLAADGAILAPAPDGGVAPPPVAASSGSYTSGDSGSSTSGDAGYGLPNGGDTVTPPDGGYPPT